MKPKNIIQEKSYAFALEIIKLFKELKNQREFIISKQVLRSSTAVGAMVEEAIGAESKKDFIHKMSISYKEARETHYWIRLLKDSDMLPKQKADKLLLSNEEILKIIGSIQKSAKANLNKK
jgi:four helix bundle protein